MVLREWEFSQRTWISIDFFWNFTKKNGCPVYLQVVRYPKKKLGSNDIPMIQFDLRGSSLRREGNFRNSSVSTVSNGTKTLPETNIALLVGRQAFPFGFRPIFSGELLVFLGVYSPENQHVPWKSMVGRCIPYWNGHFLGAMLVSGRVKISSQDTGKSWTADIHRHRQHPSNISTVKASFIHLIDQHPLSIPRSFANCRHVLSCKKLLKCQMLYNDMKFYIWF